MAFSTTTSATRNVIQKKQQFTQPVIKYVLSSTTNPIPCDHDYHTDIGGIFIFLISIKKIPPYAIIIIYNLLTNR